MDEARRFLRYVLPGVVYGVETASLLFIMSPAWAISAIASNMDSLGKVFGSVLVAGGLGYLFSTAHHTYHCWCNNHCDKVLDHRLIARSLKEKGIAKQLTDDEIDDPEIAMAISYQHWYNQLTIGHIGDATDKKVGSLGDQAHGLGTTFIGSNASYLTAIWIYCTLLKNVPVLHLMLMTVFWFVISYWLWSGYRRLGKIAHKTYEGTLMDAVSKPTRERFKVSPRRAQSPKGHCAG